MGPEVLELEDKLGSTLVLNIVYPALLEQMPC